jgi:hypothetical protein
MLLAWRPDLIQTVERGPEKGGLGGNHLHRNFREQVGKPAFVDEGAHEAAIIQMRENPRRNAATHIQTSGGKDLEGQVAGLGPKDRNEQVERRGAQCICRVLQRRFDDERCAVRRGRQCRRKGWWLRRMSGVAQEIVNVWQPAA